MKCGSPLRYPGGKALMTAFFVDLFKVNEMSNVTYAEPYAGGAGAAINLLLSGAVERILINDANPGVFSFWRYLTSEPERFIQTVRDTPVTLSEWYRQKAIKTDVPSFDLGFATFFLSRTNHSGVISAGPIGGNSDEKQKNATYKIDCRFNKEELILRLTAIAEKTNKIQVTNYDALDFLKTLDKNVFVYLDPPYYVKGKCLYMNYYTHKDHQALADYLQNEARFKWVLSYDDVSEIRNLYSERELYRFPLSYTVQDNKIGAELLTYSTGMCLPGDKSIRRSSTNIKLIRIEDKNI